MTIIIDDFPLFFPEELGDPLFEYDWHVATQTNLGANHYQSKMLGWNRHRGR